MLNQSSDAPRIVAVAAVVIHGEHLLAMKRSASRDAGPGLWETVSGRLDKGEDPLHAVRREISEETGLDVAVDPRPVDVYLGARGAVPMVVIVYRARWLSGEVRQTEEHDDHAWLTLEEFRHRTTLTRLVVAAKRALALDGG